MAKLKISITRSANANKGTANIEITNDNKGWCGLGVAGDLEYDAKLDSHFIEHQFGWAELNEFRDFLHKAFLVLEEQETK